MRLAGKTSKKRWARALGVAISPAGAATQSIQQDYIRSAGRKLGLGDIGGHTFRHTCRSWLDSIGTSIGVQQKLMRHAQVATTMNVYGNAMIETKREANSKAVRR